MVIAPLGDSAVVVTFGDPTDESSLRRALAVANVVRAAALRGVLDVVTAYTSVAVFFDPARARDWAEFCAELEQCAQRASDAFPPEERLVEIPVSYGGADGPDLTDIATRAGITIEAAIALHSGADYRVRAVGFAPGFAYLSGLPKQLHTPRRATPRTRVAAGSVGIGGAQTGVYPLATPGGWNLIGRAAVGLFDVNRADPALLRTGDRVRFKAVSADELVAPEVRSGKADTPAANGVGALRIVKAGMLTTVQDGGRAGWRAAGVPLSGPADAMALRVVNLLAGNREDAAALEFTLIGPEIEFLADTVIAIGGGDFGGPPRWQPVRVRAGEKVKFGPARSGCRGYLAVAGGIAVPAVLGSRSTFLRGGFGGFQGRALQDGDVLPTAMAVRDLSAHWHIDERILPTYTSAPTIRVLRGTHAGEYPVWLTGQFTVSAKSDRMGLRLSGESLQRNNARELTSAPVVPGTVQAPPDGQPIVLLADAQTIGGYPRIAQVISVDLPLLAQLKAGDTATFREVDLAEARRLLLHREHAMGILREGLAQKIH